jgi:outer membrane receptor protein involved in Fe transport
MPEKGINTGMGLGYSRDIPIAPCNLSISTHAQGFYNTIYDRITYVTSAAVSTGRYQNLGLVMRRGADIALGFKLDSLFDCCAIQLDASTGLLDARDKDTDLYLTGSPRLRAKVSVGIKLFKVVSLRTITRYTGTQFTTTDNIMTSAPYVLTDASVDVVIKRITLKLKVENIFDKEYTYSDGYSGAPREWIAGAICTF